MAQAITEVAVGAMAIAAPFVLPGMGIAISAALTNSLISAGASIALSGAMSAISALSNNQGGLSVGTSTPIGPWSYVYGTQKVGGVEIFRQSNSNTGGGTTSNDKQLHRVYALAAHPCVVDAGNFQLRIDGKQVLVQPNGAGWASYSPTQIMQHVTSMSRDANGLVTFTIAGGIAGLDGSSIAITVAADNTFNGTWIVTQPNPADDTTFNFVCGGPVASTTGGQCWTLYADYKDKIYVQFLNGNHTSTFQTLLDAGTSWSETDLCLGRTLVYVQMGYDEGVFPSSIPNVSFVLQGKNDIFDPRTGSRGFSNNAALCIADFMSLPMTQGGFGLAIGTDIPTAQLIAAANICDEAVALAGGGTIPRYTCDTFFLLNQGRGKILQDMLTSCAGRLSYQGGQFSIFPGAWLSPTLQLTDADIMGTFKWKTRHSIRDACNGVKGTFVSPENNYQQADFPPYMQDAAHGYASDLWLAEDQGERIFKDANLPCTVNSATAQRLAKIELLRTRYQMRGTVRCSMKAYQCVALDVVQITHPRYTWVNKNFEVLSSRFVWDKSGDVPTIAVELDLAETDPSIYDWSVTEQLTPQGYKQPDNVGNRVCSPPENVVLYSGPGTVVGGITYPSTVTTGADGRVQSSLYVSWTAPNDANVINGGHLEVQWQQVGSSVWAAFGKLDASSSHCFITGVTDGQQYNAQIRAVNCAGVASDWVFAGPETINDSLSTFAYSGIEVAPQALSAEAYAAGTDTIFVAPFTAAVGSMSASCLPGGPVSLTGLAPKTEYQVYYVDPYFQGGAITPIATTNPADFLNKAGYFLIGSIVTPQWSTAPNQAGYVIYAPGQFLDVGPRSTATPAAILNKLNFSTNGSAVVSERFIGGSTPQSIFGCCQFSGFAPGVLANGTTSNLNVCVTLAETTPGQQWTIDLGYVNTSGAWTTANLAHGSSATSATVNGSVISIGAYTTFAYDLPAGVLIDSAVVTCTVQTPVGSAPSSLTAAGAVNIASMTVYFACIA